MGFVLTEEMRKELIDQFCAFATKYNIAYTYDGAAMFINHWYARNRNNLDMFVKSPHYNGNYQIVVPVEWAREISHSGIDAFSDWLLRIKRDGLVKAKIHGFEYRELQAMQDRLLEKFEVMRKYNLKVLQDIGIDDLMKDIERYEMYLRDFRRRCHNGEYLNVGSEWYEKDSAKYPFNVIDGLVLTLSNWGNRKQVMDEITAHKLNTIAPKCRASKGQKLSRAIRNIAVKYGITNHPEWEREFAKFADAVNPLQAKKWTVLSLHPIDFLTISHGVSWSSCCTTDPENINRISQGDSRSSVTNYVEDGYRFSGSHMSICSSFMFDSTSFVYYTINERHSAEHPEMQLKETRQMFHFNGNTLLQNRLYPQCNDDSPEAEAKYTKIREIVQRLISECLESPNLWKLKKGYEAICSYSSTHGSGYSDFLDSRNKYCNISYLGDTPTVVNVGAYGMCPYCGCTHEYEHSINCSDCDPRR